MNQKLWVFPTTFFLGKIKNNREVKKNDEIYKRRNKLNKVQGSIDS